MTTTIQATDLQKRLQSGQSVCLLDVRTPVEHAEERIAHSILMPLDQLSAAQVMPLMAEAGLTVLVCRSGGRAERARQRLEADGCHGAVVLDGGVDAWLAAGQAVERSPKKRLPLMRQVQLIIGLLALSSSLLALFVNRQFAWVPAFLGAGLTMAGATGWCGLAILLSKMPWNRVEGCCQTTGSCSLH